MTADHDGSIYDGEVMHHRFRPKRHRFVYKIQSFLFDIDALERLDKRCRWFSLNRFNLFSFYYRDFGDGSGNPPRQYLERILREQGFEQPLAKAQLLCYPKILGYSFNPLSVYYCYSDNERLFAIIYEVSNTFSQRHSYLIPVKPSQQHDQYIRQSCDKSFYVSPFIAMQARYHFRMSQPGERLTVAIRETQEDEALLHAVFRGKRQPLNDAQLVKGFCRLPFMTLKVTAAIHWEALRLFLKGVKLVRRPDEPSSPVSRIDQ